MIICRPEVMTVVNSFLEVRFSETKHKTPRQIWQTTINGRWIKLNFLHVVQSVYIIQSCTMSPDPVTPPSPKQHHCLQTRAVNIRISTWLMLSWHGWLEMATSLSVGSGGRAYFCVRTRVCACWCMRIHSGQVSAFQDACATVKLQNVKFKVTLGD